MTSIRPLPDAAIPAPSNNGTLRGEIALNKLAALMPAADVAQTGARGTPDSGLQGSQAARVSGTAMPDGNGSGAAQAGSTRETLSFAARTILDLLGRADSPAPRAAASLLPAPPAGTAQQQALPVALARLVDRSGLFYESHLAQWLTGARTLESVRAEPQAMLGQQAQAAPGQAQAAVPLLPAPGNPHPPSGVAPGSAAAEQGTPVPAGDAQRTANASRALDALTDLAWSGPADGQAGATGLSGSDRTGPHMEGKPATASPPGTLPDTAAQRRPPAVATATQAYQNMAQSSAPTQPAPARHAWPAEAGPAPAFQAAVPQGPAVHPAAEGFVRQQLELLAAHQFRWVGDAWPGTHMAWEIAPPPVPDEGRAHTAQGQTWSTRLLLALPQLGTVEVRLALTGGRLEARLAATEQDTAARMDAARARLQSRLQASGIALTQLAIDGNAAVQEPGT